MADAVLAYARERLRLDPVPLDGSAHPEDLAQRAASLITPSGHDPEHVLRVFAEILAPAVISCDSPRFLSFIPAAPTKASLLFDMVVSASSLQGISWLEAAGAVHAENHALRFISDLAGLPDGAGGCFVAGGSAGNLSALAVARDTAAASRRAAPERWRVAVSAQTHSSVANTLRILGCAPFDVATDGERMTGATLAAALDSDPDAGSVCAVVATAGTTNAGIVDDIAGIAEVCRTRGLWLHVDGAYGAAALLAPSARHLFDGVEHADSLVVDPHKWLYAPFDCAALLYREPRLAGCARTGGLLPRRDPRHRRRLEPLRLRLSPDPSRTRAAAVVLPGGARHRCVPRRNRGDAHASALRRSRTCTQSRSWSSYREPDLSIVLFRRPGWSADDYSRWSDELLAAQVAFVMPTKWAGDTVARLAFLHPGTTIEIVDEIIATTR